MKPPAAPALGNTREMGSGQKRHREHVRPYGSSPDHAADHVGLSPAATLVSTDSRIASAHVPANLPAMDQVPDETPGPRTRKKPSYPILEPLRDYLRRYRRERELPITYERLRAFKEAIPLTASDGRPTLWDSVIYDSADIAALNEDLKRVYALLKVDGDFSVV